MDIKLANLNYQFKVKPLLIGGKAMEYYGLRKAGDDVDFIISKEDYQGLVEKYPENKADIFGDLGVKKDGYEMWKTICLYDYDFLAEKAVEVEDYLVISLEKLLFLKCLGARNVVKYQQDVDLIVNKFFEIKYGPK